MYTEPSESLDTNYSEEVDVIFRELAAWEERGKVTSYGLGSNGSNDIMSSPSSARHSGIRLSTISARPIGRGIRGNGVSPLAAIDRNDERRADNDENSERKLLVKKILAELNEVRFKQLNPTVVIYFFVVGPTLTICRPTRSRASRMRLAQF
jgi:hypothetical protein